MVVEWTLPALKSISQIKSKYYSAEETDEYKLKLIQRIENQILVAGKLFPSHHFKNTYIIYIDRFIISYRPSKDGSKYIVTAIKHMRQRRKY